MEEGVGEGEEVQEEDEGKVGCLVQRKVLAANEIPPSSGDREKLPAANPHLLAICCTASGLEPRALYLIHPSRVFFDRSSGGYCSS